MFSCESFPLHSAYVLLMCGRLVWIREYMWSEYLVCLDLTHYRWWQEGIESQAIDRCNRIGMPVRTILGL